MRLLILGDICEGNVSSPSESVLKKFKNEYGVAFSALPEIAVFSKNSISLTKGYLQP